MENLLNRLLRQQATAEQLLAEDSEDEIALQIADGTADSIAIALG